MIVSTAFQVDEEQMNYLDTSARLRGVSRSVLMIRTMELILKDQLFLSILDDADKPSIETARKPRGTGKRNMPPRDKLFDGLPRDKLFDGLPRAMIASAPMRKFQIGRPRKERTKIELMNELQQAVINTGGELVE